MPEGKRVRKGQEWGRARKGDAEVDKREVGEVEERGRAIINGRERKLVNMSVLKCTLLSEL